MGTSSEVSSSVVLGLVSTGYTTLIDGGFLALAWLVVVLNTGRLTEGYSSGRKKRPAALTKWSLQILVLQFIGRFFLLILWTQIFSSFFLFNGKRKYDLVVSLSERFEQPGTEQK